MNAPALSTQITVYTGESFTFGFPKTILVPASGAQVIATATLEDGSPIPTWLEFSPDTLSVTGKAPESDVYRIKLTLTDGQITKDAIYDIVVLDRELQEAFMVKDYVVPVKKPLHIELFEPDSILMQGGYQFEASLMDGQDLPVWLQFDPVTLSFNGTPLSPQALSIKLRIHAQPVDYTMRVNIRVNPELFLKTPLSDQVFLLEGQPLVWRIPEHTFEGMKFNYIITGLYEVELPEWIRCYSNGEIIIFPHLDNSMGLGLNVTAIDEAGQTATTHFRIVTRNIQFVMPRTAPRSLINHRYLVSSQPRMVGTLVPEKGVFVAWQSDGERPFSHISGALIDFHGNNIVPEFVINKDDQSVFVSGPMVSTFANGNIFVAWRNSENSLKAKIMGWNSKVVKEEFELFKLTQNIEYISINQYGEDIIIITTIHDIKHSISAHIISPDGDLLHKDIVISVSPAEVLSPKILALPNDHLLLTYIERDLGTRQIHIKAELFDKDFNLNKTMVLYSVEWTYKLDTLLLSNGNIMVAWTGTPRAPPSNTKLYSLILSSDLNIVKPRFTAASLPNSQPTLPSLMSLHNGDVLALWDDRLEDSGQGTTLSIAGEVLHKKVMIHNAANPDSDRGILVSLGNGKAMLVLAQKEDKSTNIWAEILQEKFARNMVPDMIGQIEDQMVYQGDMFTMTFPELLFVDYDSDPLRITLALNGGSAPLPFFMEFHPWNKTITIDPQYAEKGSYSILAKAEDPFGAYVMTEFVIEIGPHPVKFFVSVLLLIFGGILIGVYMYKRISGGRSYDMLQISSRNRSSAKSSESNKDPTPLTRADIELLMTFSTDKIPNGFLCPITGELMSDPYAVITTEGAIFHSYEREALDKWFLANETDPMTRRKKDALVSNLALRVSIELFVKQLTVEDLTTDKGLYMEIEKWIKRRGKLEVLENERISHILEIYEESKKVLKQNKELQVIVNFEKKMVV